MIPVADAPLLALPGGSLVQFLLMTLPLLGVYLYFLYLAIDRKNIANPDDPRYGDDRIRLMDILYTYLATLILFCSLAFYLMWFVYKRRRLSRRYEREAITILGNVEYEDRKWETGKNCCANLWHCFANGLTLRNNYGTVVYDLERVANHPACDYEERRRGRKQLTGVVSKRVRVYYRYPREQVSILVLPTHPCSGQPKIDMEADWASFSQNVGLPSESSHEASEPGRQSQRQADVPLSRDRSLGVLLVSAAWIAFLFGAALYTVIQIQLIEDVYDDESAKIAWIVFWSVVGGGIPVIAVGGNFVRWKVYERWMLRSGTKKKNKSKKTKKKEDRREYEGEDEEAEGGSQYIQMT